MKTAEIKVAMTLVYLSLSTSLFVGCQNTHNTTKQPVSQTQPMLVEESEFIKLRTLAERGDAEAQYKLGLMYDLGRGVPQNDKKAFKWYEKSANQGLAKAQTRLGFMYRHGKGVAVNHTKATQLFFEAYEQGDEEAHYHLGSIYVSHDNPKYNK